MLRLRFPPPTIARAFVLAAACGLAGREAAAAAGDEPPAIHDVQGAGHRSPLEGRAVEGVRGVVTSVQKAGFTLQAEDAHADDRPETSEAVFVHARPPPAVVPGDVVRVSGTVAEYRPENRQAQLTVTEIGGEPRVEVLAHGAPLPRAVLLGRGGRVPPDRAAGPDGLDFFESLEGMRVELRDAVVIAPVTEHGELWVLGDGGALASGRNALGGLSRTPGDANPERILLDGSLVKLPRADTGARLSEPVSGVLGYAFGNYRIVVQAPLTASGGASPDAPVAPAREDELLVATFNVENLSPRSSAADVAALARQIVVALGAPDLLALQEVQDGSGPADDGETSAAATAQQLCAAIAAAGGPAYRYTDVSPADGADGGEPGGNIRPALLWRADRGLELVGRGSAGPHDEATLVREGVTAPPGEAPSPGNLAPPGLVPSPARLAPLDAAFTDSRKPLAAEFRWRGRPLFVVVNHWNSKGGDDPVFGERQPPQRRTEEQRVGQARVVRGFAEALLTADVDADLVVLGDFNDVLDSPALAALTDGGVLHDLAAALPPEERWTYVYEGQAQQLDHILVSPHLLATAAPEFRCVHVNAAFREQASDHDPCLVRLRPGAAADAAAATDVQPIAPAPLALPPARPEAVPPELPDAALKADVILLTRRVRRAGRMIAVQVERYVNGRGPDEVYVADESSEPAVIGVQEREAWLLFLFLTPEGLVVLVGVQDSVVALAPDGTRSHAFPPRTPESLTDLVLALRACRRPDGAHSARDLVQSLLAAQEADLRLVALQLAGHGLRSDPARWQDTVSFGAAHALGALVDEQPLVRRAARELLPALPPLVARTRLDALLAAPALPDAVRAELLAAARALPAGEGAAPAEPEAEAADAAELHARFAAARPALLAQDVPQVQAALASPDTLQQQVGALWVAALLSADAALPELTAAQASERLAAWLEQPPP